MRPNVVCIVAALESYHWAVSRHDEARNTSAINSFSQSVKPPQDQSQLVNGPMLAIIFTSVEASPRSHSMLHTSPQLPCTRLHLPEI